eukprot:1153432-Pelagomonas_calceolata.AAC.1
MQQLLQHSREFPTVEAAYSSLSNTTCSASSEPSSAKGMSGLGLRRLWMSSSTCECSAILELGTKYSCHGWMVMEAKYTFKSSVLLGT